MGADLSELPVVLLNLVPKQLREWEKSEDSILKSLKGLQQVMRIGIPKWPKMEAYLYFRIKEV